MKNIGLLTVYFADYGSYYQATALYKVIEKLGYKCELINENIRYKKSPKIIIIKHFLKICPKSIAKKLLSFIPSAANTYRVLQNDLKHFSVSKKYFNRFQDYDCVVIGSDELWAFTNPKVKYFKENFGIGIEKPHITYAVSAASLKQNINKKRRTIIKNGIKSFSAISVRDTITKEWVENLAKVKTHLVLDPTLLNPYFKIENAKEEPYVGVYGEHFSSEQIIAIKDFAKANNYKLVALSWKHKWCDSFLDTNSAEELQVGFAKSSYIMSSTFHGTIFAIIQKKEFTSFLSEVRGKKVRALLKMLMLEDRLFEGKIIETKINYESVEKILEPLREESLNFLKQSLENALPHSSTLSINS